MLRRTHHHLWAALEPLEDRTQLDAAFGWAFGIGADKPANSTLKPGYVSATPTTVRTDGTLYSGISITKTGVSPRSSVRLRAKATSGATTRPTAYIANIASPGTHQA